MTASVRKNTEKNLILCCFLQYSYLSKQLQIPFIVFWKIFLKSLACAFSYSCIHSHPTPTDCKRFVYSINFTEDKENSMNYRSSHSEVFLGKGVPKICSKFTGEHSCRSVKSHISMDVLLSICRIFSEHLFLRTPQDGCFWNNHHP